MVKVKTFTSSLKIFHVHNELMELDKTVNDFLQQNNIKKWFPFAIALPIPMAVRWASFASSPMKNKISIGENNR